MQQFDYVIIGAGSAGCVLANRLTASGQNTVLLLEAGGEDKDMNISIPAAFPKLYKSKNDWAYHSTPSGALKQRSLFLPRGKTLGGSSSINAMIYMRGNRSDYDAWAAAGNTGWSYKEVLPYFKKSEGQTVHHNEFHGTEGPLTVANAVYVNKLTEVFLEAAAGEGFSSNPDFNGAEQEGFGHFQVTQRNGKRCSAAVAFLHPARQRPNLTVYTSALVQRILLKDASTTGVEFVKNGKKQQVNARKEVLLCAGAFNSPQILMLSGIGDAEHLRQHNIPVVHHLPGVGRNLQEHLVYFAMFHSSYTQSLDAVERFPAVLKHLGNYFLNKKGPFASNVASAGGFYRTSPDYTAPDQQIHFGPCYFNNHGFDNPKTGYGYSIGSVLLTPNSRGRLTLASADPAAMPVIDYNFLSDAEDVRRSIEGYKVCQRIGLNKAFEPYRKSMFIPEKPLYDDAAIEDIIRATAETIYHPVGTCKMGSDAEAVTDAHLRVHGIQGLRVIDASIMPTIVRGNTNAPVMMIAEKAADLIISA
jgi:choline dehydrogenase